MSDHDEYAMEAARFIEALREQRAMQLPGGLYHLTQIEMRTTPTASRAPNSLKNRPVTSSRHAPSWATRPSTT